MNEKLSAEALSALLGQFTPENLGSRLFMERSDLLTPENFLVWFHERFHYLQVVFTPYGHLKWASYRTSTTDIIEAWANLSLMLNQPRRLPIKEYLLNDTPESVKLACNIWLCDLKNDIYKIVERGGTSCGNMSLFAGLTYETCCPIIMIYGQEHRMRGIDILESFAKFEEAMLGEIITGRTLDELINPNKLNPEYYSALYYFIETLGPERLVEFPIACELALATAHIPLPYSIENFQKYAPNWRFIKLVEKLKTIENLPTIDYNDNKTFFDYANTVLLACEFETLDEAWVAAEEYAEMSDLTMAEEMKAAIRYKKKHPWMLSYPMCNEDDFFSVEFNRFEPYFTIMDDGISYNSDHVRSEELVVENHMQALAQQICGYPSRYCRDSFKLMCGFSYMGTNNCPHYLNGECDGYVDAEPQLPELILDEDSNIKSGCSFELLLKSHNIDIKDIEVGIMRLVTYDEITNAAKKHFSA